MYIDDIVASILLIEDAVLIRMNTSDWQKRSIKLRKPETATMLSIFKSGRFEVPFTDCPALPEQSWRRMP